MVINSIDVKGTYNVRQKRKINRTRKTCLLLQCGLYLTIEVGLAIGVALSVVDAAELNVDDLAILANEHTGRHTIVEVHLIEGSYVFCFSEGKLQVIFLGSGLYLFFILSVDAYKAEVRVVLVLAPYEIDNGKIVMASTAIGIPEIEEGNFAFNGCIANLLTIHARQLERHIAAACVTAIDGIEISDRYELLGPCAMGAGKEAYSQDQGIPCVFHKGKLQ
jgi:hypothetical protein